MDAPYVNDTAKSFFGNWLFGEGSSSRAQTPNLAEVLPSAPQTTFVPSAYGVADIATSTTGRDASVLSASPMANTPIEDVDEDKANALMAHELTNLSIEDRESSYEDMHGVASEIIETPELIEQSLGRLEEEIQSIYFKRAYNLAEAKAPGYVRRRKLRLMFLRAERFDAKKAAIRLVGWFDWKLDLFSEEKLCKDITLDDLDKNALKSVKGGWQQILPQRDSRGRAVFFCTTFRFRQGFTTAKSVWQKFWYNMMSLMEDERNQKSGIVMVMYSTGDVMDLYTTNPTHPMYLSFWKTPRMLLMFPCRMDAVHVCYSDPVCRPVLTFMQLRAGPYLRPRIRLHFGCHMECQYALMTFGIPTSTIPLDINGESLKLAPHKKWLKRRKAKEDWLRQQHRAGNMDAEYPGVEIPSKFDVILGRGRPFSEHPGNQVLNSLITSFREEYDTTQGKGNKAKLAQRIIQSIHDSGGRFLKRNDQIYGWWQEVSNDVAVDKVKHGFRYKREERAGGSGMLLVASRGKDGFIASYSKVVIVFGSSLALHNFLPFLLAVLQIQVAATKPQHANESKHPVR